MLQYKKGLEYSATFSDPDNLGAIIFMKQFRSIFAFALCLIIGLGSVTASAHNHDDHQENTCSVSVLQHSAAAVAAETSKTYVTRVTAPCVVHNDRAATSHITGRQLARAPPQIL